VVEVYDPAPSPRSILTAPSERSRSLRRLHSLSADQAFALHSNPGSNRVIYLDFQGQGSHVDGFWNNGQPFETPRFSLDGDPNSWSDAELNFVQQVWQAVSEDYAPFNIDVTTQDPGSDNLTRSDASDQNYGTHLAITMHTSWSPSCGCGGVAGIGLFDSIGFTATKGWVFTDGTGSNAIFTALAASHEIGHTLGLLHQGYKDDKGKVVEYASGWTPYGPIMGAPYVQAVTQWSNSDYKSAYVNGASKNKQDDISVMQTHGAVIKTDDYADNAKAAYNLTSAGGQADGLISTRADSDWFAVNTSSNNISVMASPSLLMPNLDISLTLYNSKNQVLATSNPATTYQGPATSGGGMVAGIEAKVTPGTYYVKVDGAGQGLMSAFGSYSDYGSLGPYHIQTVDPILITDSSLSSGTRNSSYNQALHSSGGSGNITWSLVSGSLPSGVNLENHSGQWVLTGTPTIAGAYPVSLRATDANGMQSPDTSLTLNIDPDRAPHFITQVLPEATRTVAYSATFLADSYTNLPTQWTVTGLPSGMSYQAVAPKAGVPSSMIIKGAATQAGRYEVTISESNSMVATQKYILIVNALPSPVISTTPTNPTLGKAYSFQMKATSVKSPLSWSLVSGSLPPGLSLSSSGQIKGTASDSNGYSFTIKVVDANGEQSQKDFVLSAVTGN